MNCLCAVDEGPVFAMCMTGQEDQATLNQWISGLQENNPILGQVPTLFRLDTGPREVQPGPDQEQQEQQQRSHPETEEATVEEESEVEKEPQRQHRMKQ